MDYLSAETQGTVSRQDDMQQFAGWSGLDRGALSGETGRLTCMEKGQDGHLQAASRSAHRHSSRGTPEREIRILTSFSPVSLFRLPLLAHSCAREISSPHRRAASRIRKRQPSSSGSELRTAQQLATGSLGAQFNPVEVFVFRPIWQKLRLHRCRLFPGEL